MTASPSEAASLSSQDSALEVRKEAYTMALYVAVCLLAALTAIAERADAGHVSVFKIIWGTTIGLALAHWFVLSGH